MKNPFVLMALAMASRLVSVNTKTGGRGHGHNKHSRHRVAMDKRAARKLRNRRRA